MSGILLALLSAFFFGLVAVATQTGLRRASDPRVGALVTQAVAFLASLLLAASTGASLDGVGAGDLWPFLVAGAIAPGLSQILFVWSIRDAGPSRTSVVVGATPLVSSLIAIWVLGEPLRAALVVGTILAVIGVASLAWERKRPEHFRALGLVIAFACVGLYSAQNNLVRWAVGGNSTVPPLIAASAILASASASALVYVAAAGHLSPRRLRGAFAPFVPAGLALGFAWDALTEAFDHARLTVVAPITATQALWAVGLSVLVLGRVEVIGWRLMLAALLIVSGAAVVGATR